MREVFHLHVGAARVQHPLHRGDEGVLGAKVGEKGDDHSTARVPAPARSAASPCPLANVRPTITFGRSASSGMAFAAVANSRHYGMAQCYSHMALQHDLV